MQKRQQIFLEYPFMFSAGAVLYAATEVVYRGYTHWTMVATGGLCSVLLHMENRRLRPRRMALRCLVGAATVTAVEYAVGTLVNRVLRWNVWNYSKQFLNLNGQICPLFSFFWFLLCFPALSVSCYVSDNIGVIFPARRADGEEN